MNDILPMRAIEKAKRQGWHPRESFGAPVGTEINIGWEMSASKMWQPVFFDRHFWLALAKDCGWGEIWKYHALRAMDLALERKDMTSFWEEVLKEKYI